LEIQIQWKSRRNKSASIQGEDEEPDVLNPDPDALNPDPEMRGLDMYHRSKSRRSAHRPSQKAKGLLQNQKPVRSQLYRREMSSPWRIGVRPSIDDRAGWGHRRIVGRKEDKNSKE
jgi:hypothetical protein